MTKFTELKGDAADRFSGGWTVGLRNIADIAKIDAWTASQKDALTTIACQLSDISLVPDPLLRRPAWATKSIVGALAANSRRSLDLTGYQDPTGKKNASVAQAAGSLLRKLSAISYVEAETGLKLDHENVPMWYITYETPGAGLGLHLDTREFGDINMLLCLDRVDERTSEDASATTLVTRSGVRRYAFVPGECLIFDGACTPHGRTPVISGEKVSLMAVGFTVLS